jgi:YggT family protein
VLILANLLITVSGLCSFVINAYSFIIIVAAFMSWCNPNPYNGFVRAITSMTEPVFYRLRSRFPFLVFNGFDCTPIAVLLALQLFNGVIVQTLLQLGQRIAM